MREIIDALKNIEGKIVNICTSHKLYGEQHINIGFVPETEIGLGFHCKEQVIYIDKEDVVDWFISDNKIVINGNMMSISIV